MTDDVIINKMAQMVIVAQADAIKRGGILNLWTIYKRPTDHPTMYVARRHEVGKVRGKSTPTDDMLQATGDDIGLGTLRQVMLRAGLTRIMREPGDEPQIVETWL